MRQLPRIALCTGVTILVLVALLAGVMRLMLPQLNHWRTPLLHIISSVSGYPVTAAALYGRWEITGPALELHQLNVVLADGGTLKVKKVALNLNIWQSLLHARWQFGDIDLRQLDLNSHSTLFKSEENSDPLRSAKIKAFFLSQFSNLNIDNSRIRFLTPADQPVSLLIPRLVWLNERARHRASGEMSLSGHAGTRAAMQLRVDLHDKNGVMDNGQIWLQARDLQLMPWLASWLRTDSGLKHAAVSLESWFNVQQGEIGTGNILLHQGEVVWQEKSKEHRLTAANMMTHLARYQTGWTLTLPQTRLRTEDIPWPEGGLALFWQPDTAAQQVLRVRATRLALARLVPLAAALLPHFTSRLPPDWRALRPQADISVLALDIPLKNPEQTRFYARWRQLSWQPWRKLPGMEKLAGSVNGCLSGGQLRLALADVTLPYQRVFRAPLRIYQANGQLAWQWHDGLLKVFGKDLDIQARSVWAHGDFSFSHRQNQPPQLAILAGFNISQAADVWRYFPKRLMGKGLTRYLDIAVRGGQTRNATLVFAGNPKQFPFRHHEGTFAVWAPLRHAMYDFRVGWPVINDLDIDLAFINDGLWMKSSQLTLAKGVEASNVTAVIPVYRKRKLFITGHIRGDGEAITRYFTATPLKKTLAVALKQVQPEGEVHGQLRLDVPLAGGLARARGDVLLDNNALFIRPLNSRLTQVQGHFRYDNGDLVSGPLQANWYGQPLGFRFVTRADQRNYRIAIQLAGNWQPAGITRLPAMVRDRLSGSFPWQSQVAIALPRQREAEWHATLTGDLKNVSSYLPAPLDKRRGDAMPVRISMDGDVHHFDVRGEVAGRHRFNSRWLTGELLRLERGIWANDGQLTPSLPDRQEMVLNLPPFSGEAWLAMLKAAGSEKQGAGIRHWLPGRVLLHTPGLTLGGQQWRELNALLTTRVAGSKHLVVKGRELDGALDMPVNGPWSAQLNYLYYNPQWAKSDKLVATSLLQNVTSIHFQRWPVLRLSCASCWLHGQNVGRIQATLTPRNDTLLLTDGVLDTGNARLNLAGEWLNRPGEQRTALWGTFSGKNFSDTARWFGITSPLRNAPFTIGYDLRWRAPPWQPAAATLNGVLTGHFGRGQIDSIHTGYAGQLLRLFSIDGLLRKLRLDFSDTFADGFWFDAINGTAWIGNGILHTRNLRVDGLEADIAMQGRVDLIKRQIAMKAVVTPEISATVGVVTALAINPVVGAAVFVAGKALGPLWHSMPVLHYAIQGPMDKPVVSKVSPLSAKKQLP